MGARNRLVTEGDSRLRLARKGAPTSSDRTLSKLRRRAALMLWAEGLVLAIAPAGGLLLAYAALALFGFGGAWLFGATAGFALAAFGYGLFKFHRPGGADIDRRIERASKLRHRPFATIGDAPANADPADTTSAAWAIWQAHQRRIAGSLAGARAGGPDLRAAARDPYALRGLLLLLLLTGIVFAGPAAPSRLAAAFILPAWPFTGPRVSAWITPPAYDPSPPLLLAPGQSVTVLTGSQLTTIVNGPRHAPALRLGTTRFAATELGPNSHRADATLDRSGRLLIGPWWHRIGNWNITVVQPAAPSISLAGLSQPDPQHLQIGWHASDKYGLASISLRLLPNGYPDALPEDFVLDPNGQAARLNISDTPYAGLSLNLTLNARNLAGVNTSTTSPVSFALLPALLNDRTAEFLSGIRQRLALQPDRLAQAGRQVGQIAAFPPTLISYAADLQLAALGAAMAGKQTTPLDAVDRLGRLIDEIEAGPDYEPARALAAANQALMRALEQGLNGNLASQQQLQNLLQAMQNALARHLAAISPSPSAGLPPGSQVIGMSSLSQLAQKIAADEAAGKTAQAAQELRQLEATLNALQSARPMSAAQAAQAAAAAQGGQDLARLMSGEAGLLNQTHQGKGTPAQQQALQNGLAAAQGALQKAGINLPGMDGAGKAMGEAQQALGQPDDDAAELAEAGAIQNLQRAAAALAAATARSFSVGDGSGTLPEENPLGESANGAPDEQSQPGFGTPAANPADAIQQQIIKQDENANLPAATHQYFGRLLSTGQ